MFEALVAKGIQPAISAYTTFEVYRGLASTRVDKMKLLIKPFTSVEVELDTFKIAAALTTCIRTIMRPWATTTDIATETLFSQLALFTIDCTS